MKTSTIDQRPIDRTRNYIFKCLSLIDVGSYIVFLQFPHNDDFPINLRTREIDIDIEIETERLVCSIVVSALKNW